MSQAQASKHPTRLSTHLNDDYKEFKPKSSYDDDKAPGASSCTGAGAGAGAGVGTGSGAKN